VRNRITAYQTKKRSRCYIWLNQNILQLVQTKKSMRLYEVYFAALKKLFVNVTV